MPQAGTQQDSVAFSELSRSTASSLTQEPSRALESGPPTTGMEPKTEAEPGAQKTPLASQAATPQGKPPVQDELARVALSLVGVDPEAEQYWAEAINDPTLSAHERQDLIEDLNEEGLADPHHPTLEELPLIMSRLELIGELAPFAMDKVNADAFEEAAKDLFNMYTQLTQQ